MFYQVLSGFISLYQFLFIIQITFYFILSSCRQVKQANSLSKVEIKPDQNQLKKMTFEINNNLSK